MNKLTSKQINEAAKMYAFEVVSSAPTKRDLATARKAVAMDFKAGAQFVNEMNKSLNIK
ncbi:MAG: hypothetical protein QHC79_09715 [Pseudosphingobacterium sp.]|nr:hypothetical protein [Pseudosphingobacterium sp.]